MPIQFASFINNNAKVPYYPFAKFQKPEKSNVTNSYSDYKGIYNTSINPIFFRGLAKINDVNSGFDITLEQNRFQLGEYKAEDGTVRRFQPDIEQIECARHIYDGSTLIYCAPTGSGKTAIANYAITTNLYNDKETIFTAPLKALANDKYREFCSIYGKDNVGILTGDIKYNTSAPVKIMTTEVYNNIVSSNNNLSNVGTVIFDEAHYLSDEDRGNVWENSIMNTPPDVQILCLSATIGNAPALCDWMQTLTKRPVKSVESSPKNRYVPLDYTIYSRNSENKFIDIQTSTVDISKIDPDNLTNKQKRAMRVLAPNEPENITARKLISDLTLDDDDSTEFLKREFRQILSIVYPKLGDANAKIVTGLLQEPEKTTVETMLDADEPDYAQLIADLKTNSMLPAIVFSLSQKGCEKVTDSLLEAGVDLTNDDEKAQISEIIKKYLDEGTYFGNNYDPRILTKGYAYHHAGLLPQYRKLIEELFSKKLLKCVAATSTLSAGINMPARTTVITGVNYMKYDPKTNEVAPVDISASEFHQMSGRAGRRGMDELGNVVFYNLRNKKNPITQKSELEQAYKLLNSPADDIRSRFKPDYQMLASFWDTHSDDKELDEIINSSFRVYLAKDRDKQVKALKNSFKRAQDVLLKQNFLEKDNSGRISITPKGKILKMSQGLNPLMTAGLIYDEKLKGMSVEQLCQIAGMISGCDEQSESPEMPELTLKRMKNILTLDDNKDDVISGFESAKTVFKNYESKILKSQKEARLKPEDIKYSNSVSSVLSYLWAYLNDKNETPVDNFRLITRKISKDTVGAYFDDGLIKDYNRLVEEGHVYKILSQSLSVLKQIENICDFALMNPELYPNSDYYLELKQNAQNALLLISQKPLNDELSL